MKEYMLLVHNQNNHLAALTPKQHEEFLQKCMDYIADIKMQGKLIAAQPLIKDGKIITGSNGSWKETAFDETNEVQVGYYHILANDLDDAVAIAKGNPEFEYTPKARVEVRPIKMKEETTKYVYPKG